MTQQAAHFTHSDEHLKAEAAYDLDQVLEPVEAHQATCGRILFERAMIKAVIEDRPQIATRALNEALEAELSPNTLSATLVDVCAHVFRLVYHDTPHHAHSHNAQILEDTLEQLQRLNQDGPTGALGTVLLGNAWLDYHDLGRPIIATALRATGYRVLDLGLSVSNQRFVEVALAEGASVIVVSALLRHTARHLPALRDALTKRGRSDISLIAGGAPFLKLPGFNTLYDVDGVSFDPSSTVHLVSQLCH